MRKGHWMWSFDHDSFYNRLAAAQESWDVLGLVAPDGTRYVHTVLSMGVAPAPYASCLSPKRRPLLGVRGQIASERRHLLHFNFDSANPLLAMGFFGTIGSAGVGVLSCIRTSSSSYVG